MPDDKPTARLHDIEVEEYLAECLITDPLHLDEEFVRVGSDFGYWNERFADAALAAMKGKLELDRTYSRTLLEVRELAVQAGVKMTDKTAEAQVINSDDYLNAHLTYVEAEAERIRMKGRVEAVGHKKDMVQSLGAKMRIEMEGDPAVRELHRGPLLSGRG